MTPSELADYVTVMREHGATVFKAEGIHIELGPAPAPPIAPRDPDAPVLAPRKSDYERMLFAATEGLPDEDSDG